MVGRFYLEKYRHDSNQEATKLMTAENVKYFQNAEILIDKWIGRLRNYVTQVVPEMIEEKTMVFMMEAQIFLTHTEPPRELCVVVG